MSSHLEFSLSPSKLNLLKECEACFYNTHVLGLPRASTPFPSLPNGLDRVIKAYTEPFRIAGTMPPDLEGKVPGKLYGDPQQLKRWRFWKTGLTATLQFGQYTVQLIGAIDDCLVIPSMEYGPQQEPIYVESFAAFDYKSKGGEPNDSGEQYYGSQLDCYALMFRSSGFRPYKSGYLWYWWPETTDKTTGNGVERGAPVRFLTKLYELAVDPERAVKLCSRAVDVLTADKRPASSPACSFCGYAETWMRRQLEIQKAAAQQAPTV